MRTSVFFLTIVLLIISITTVQAKIIHVPADSTTIQGGIDGAVDGDTVLVADGTYTGDGNRDIDFTGKGIVVMSENGPENCVIDCERIFGHRGFYFHSGENSSSVLRGFTITKGQTDAGAGIYCYESSPTISGNIVSLNWGSDFGGGGIYCYMSSATIIGNTIMENNANMCFGGGIYCYGSSPKIMGNTIMWNNAIDTSGGGIYCSNSSPTIQGNSIIDNLAGDPRYNGGFGGGIYCASDSYVTIIGNIITENRCFGSAGAIACIGTVVIMNNTITENSADNGSDGISCLGGSNTTITNTIFWDYEIALRDSSTLTVSYTDMRLGQATVDIEDGSALNWGEGNIDDDPMFRSFKGFDFLLHPFSPCVDAGDPSIKDGLYDWHPKWPDWYPNGPRSDMGAYGGPENKNWIR